MCRAAGGGVVICRPLSLSVVVQVYSVIVCKNSDISTQLFFVQTKRGVIETDRNRGKLYNKFKRLAGLAETRAGVRRIGDELNKD